MGEQVLAMGFGYIEKLQRWELYRRAWDPREERHVKFQCM
jgi:hypothetical protein